MRDGDIDYSGYSRRELEEALAGIDGRAYPKNFANLRSAYERSTGASSPPALVDPAPGTDLFGVALPQPRYDAHGRYLPNDIPREKRTLSVVLSLLLLAYGTYGVRVNDLYLPGKRHRGLHLHDAPAWVMYGAMLSACLVLLSVVVDHHDRRNNERSYRAFANAFELLGWTLFALALLVELVRQARA